MNKIEKPFAQEIRDKKEAGFERGKNVHIKVSFCRHEEPGKTPEGMSADFLTEKGIEKAKLRGKENPHQYILVFGSKAVKRARETSALELENASGPDGMATAVNKKMPDASRKMGFDKFASGEYIIYRNGDLDPVKGLKNMWLEAGQKAKEAVEKEEIPQAQKENYQYEYYLNNPERAKELKSETAYEVAQAMTHRIVQCLKMSEKLYEGIDLNARNYSHGPRLECVLKHALRQENGKLGFDKLEEIGGPFKPGESFDLDVKRNEKGELEPVKISRGDKIIGTLDSEAIENLKEEYEKRMEK